MRRNPEARKKELEVVRSNLQKRLDKKKKKTKATSAKSHDSNSRRGKGKLKTSGKGPSDAAAAAAAAAAAQEEQEHDENGGHHEEEEEDEEDCRLDEEGYVAPSPVFTRTRSSRMATLLPPPPHPHPHHHHPAIVTPTKTTAPAALNENDSDAATPVLPGLLPQREPPPGTADLPNSPNSPSPPLSVCPSHLLSLFLFVLTGISSFGSGDNR